jgi:hypothetical protein
VRVLFPDLVCLPPSRINHLQSPHAVLVL